MKIKNKPCIKNIFSIFFSLMIIFPYEASAIKISLLGIFFIFFINKNRFISKSVLSWLLIYLTSGILWILYGAFRGNAVQYYFTTQILWVILYMFFGFIIDTRLFFEIIDAIIFSVFVVFLLGIVAFVLFNFFGRKHFLNFEYSFRIGFPFLTIFSGSIINTIFIFPFLFSYFIISMSRKRKKVILFLILGVIFIFMTSRRSLYLNTLLVPFFSFFLFLFFPVANKKYKIMQIFAIFSRIILLIVLFLIMNSFYKWVNFKEVFEFFMNAFKLTKTISKNVDEGGYKRALQFLSLIEGWKEHPFFGNGTAANASVTRSYIPGNYELTYIVLLFQRGLIGFTIFWIQLIYIFASCFKLLKKYPGLDEFIIAILTGFICFIIANSTNPYLEAFDHIWILFLPIVMINIINTNPEGFYEGLEKWKKKYTK